MAYIYFYGYVILIWAVLLLSIRFRPMHINHFIIGFVTIAYSLTYEILFGNWLGLYYYLDKTNSSLYIALAGILVYPLLNILYVLFLPKSRKYFLPYTVVWITAMLLFEYITVRQNIIVFTGWKPIPWSIATMPHIFMD